MAKQIEDDEDFPEEEDFEEEYDEQVEEKPKSNPRMPIKTPIQVERTNKFSRPVPKKAEDKFVAYHVPTIDGLMDKTTNQMVTQDLWEALAMILSKLNRIEESLG